MPFTLGLIPQASGVTDLNASTQFHRANLSAPGHCLDFTIIVASHNDWAPLQHFLRSLAQQTITSSFDVIVVDDGSSEAAPEFISKWKTQFPLTIIRQPHAGISAARNRGTRSSKGSVLVFADADCMLDRDCLRVLERTINALPEKHYFQLHLVGDCSGGPVGRAEQLRLITLQNHFLRPDGSIRYLNTAGFAIRRAKVDIDADLFDPAAIRAEDTLLLANLVKRGEPPFFVPGAIVQHIVPLSLVGYLCKAMQSACLEAKTFDIISSAGVKIRVSHRERLSMLWSAWKFSQDRAIGRAAWFVLLARQVLHLIGGFYR
jgi:glycosyltransferase involved in cell wall biosynthesis